MKRSDIVKATALILAMNLPLPNDIPGVYEQEDEEEEEDESNI